MPENCPYLPWDIAKTSWFFALILSPYRRFKEIEKTLPHWRTTRNKRKRTCQAQKV
jgi:hypothetical protein